MRSRSTLVGVLALGLLACAPRVPDMSVPEHEAAARTLERESVDHLAEYDPDERIPVDRCTNVDVQEICWTALVNPTEEHFLQAEQARDQARAHREAAQDLREAEAIECRGVSPRDRDLSPFSRVEDIASVRREEDGAVIEFHSVPGLTAEKLERAIACHRARNAVIGSAAEEMPYCPLTVPGLEVTVRELEPGFVVGLEAGDRMKELSDRLDELEARLRGSDAPTETEEP